MGVCQLHEASFVVLDEAYQMHTGLLLSTMRYIIIHEVSQISSLNEEETQDSEFRIKDSTRLHTLNLQEKSRSFFVREDDVVSHCWRCFFLTVLAPSVLYTDRLATFYTVFLQTYEYFPFLQQDIMD
ncbi:hypothetical protein L1987_29981 [Smallanthus sonchifolius]|uniref:Uncharacterized protein n=1 Tax=Smallanthus sonchifolius TaxID=185202 RepID=A0ACB9I0Y7_9ASTR|nr:hypothetical protein L1987_29981 [Smallanthus sonchifolius]